MICKYLIWKPIAERVSSHWDWDIVHILQFIAFSVEDIQRKLKEAEAREESLIRRITEKDKAMNKMR